MQTVSHYIRVFSEETSTWVCMYYYYLIWGILVSDNNVSNQGLLYIYLLLEIIAQRKLKTVDTLQSCWPPDLSWYNCENKGINQ